MKGNAHTLYIDLQRRYGKIVRVGPKKVAISDPETIPIIYGISSKYNKVSCLVIKTAILSHTE